ncbi:transcription factor E2F/dimerization partner [Cryptosporidium canis]|uniref:Transcription factor E2F/dimerization partner n=1 Tax=Cryptosporidium canis TaxID=195482 RepID=A0A9D5HW54_9CRYT|nr:transcription factor E2F/dimerization partner [Cryptosporidium canis]
MQHSQQCQQGDFGVFHNGSYIQQYEYQPTNPPTFEDNMLVFDNSLANSGELYRSDRIFSEDNYVSGYTMMKSSSLVNIPPGHFDDIHSVQSGPARTNKKSMIRRSSTSPPPRMNHPYSPNSYHPSSPYYSNSPSSSPRSLSPSLSSRHCTHSGPEQSRAESGLLLLTEKVIEYAKQSPKYEIDLQNIEIKLGVPRRRLYDITNVLEAVGLFTKPRHNIYKLNMDISSGPLQDEDNNDNITFYTKSLFELEQAISKINDSIKNLIAVGKEKGLLYFDKEILSKLCPVNTNTIVSISTPIDSSITLNPNQHSYQLLNSILRTRNRHTDHGTISVQSQILDSHWSILLKHESSQLNIDVLNGHANLLEEIRQSTLPMKCLAQQLHPNNPVDITDNFLH